MKYVLSLILLILFSCNKDSTPEQALEDLVSSRFKASSRDDVLKLTSGNLKNQILSMDDSSLKLFLDSEGLKKRKLDIVHKSCEANKCFIKYILKYDDKRSEDLDFNLEVKKIAELIKEESSWYVTDISNVKTYINSKKELRATE